MFVCERNEILTLGTEAASLVLIQVPDVPPCSDTEIRTSERAIVV